MRPVTACHSRHRSCQTFLSLPFTLIIFKLKHADKTDPRSSFLSLSQTLHSNLNVNDITQCPHTFKKPWSHSYSQVRTPSIELDGSRRIPHCTKSWPSEALQLLTFLIPNVRGGIPVQACEDICCSLETRKGRANNNSFVIGRS